MSLLREYADSGNAGVCARGDVAVVSVWCEYMGDTCREASEARAHTSK